MFAKPALAAAALSLAALAPTASAQEAEGAANAKPTPEQVEHFKRAMRIRLAFNSALGMEKVNPNVKAALMACLYNNPLSKISIASKQVLDSNPGLDEANPADLYQAAAGVCGVKFRKVDAPAAGNGETSGR